MVGKIGQAIKFDGSTNNILVPTTSTLNPNTITVSAWFYPTSNAFYSPIVSKGNSSSVGWEMSNSSGTFRATLRGATVDAFGPSVVLNKWQMGTFTYDGATLKLYFGGVLVASTAGSATLTSANDLLIGSRVLNSNRFTGSIDDVRIYNRALSPQEIQQLYAQGGGVTADHSSTVSLSSGLVGYWPFDGNALNWKIGAVSDLSGTGSNGNLVSMSTTTSPVVGKIGQALKFNGTSSYINIPDAASTYAFPNTTFTVAAWIKTTADGIIFSKPGTLLIGVTSGLFNVNLRNTSGASAALRSSTTNVSDGNWHFVVAVSTTDTSVQANNTTTLYVDGKLSQGSLTNNATYTSPGSTAAFIGQRSSANFFPGSIDDMRVYNRGLSVQEIAQLYALGK